MENLFVNSDRYKNSRDNKIVTYIIEFMILVSSFEYLIPISWFDEIALVILTVYMVVRKRKIEKSLIFTVCMFFIYCIVGLFINMRINIYSIFSLFDMIKPIFLIGLIVNTKLNSKNVKTIIYFFQVVNIPSVMVALVGEIWVNMLHRPWVIETGTYKLYDGMLILRAGGLYGHSGVFSSICSVLVIITVFDKKMGRKRWLLAMFFFVGLCCGRGRWPLFYTVMALFCYIYFNITKKNRKYILGILIIVAIVAIYPVIQFVLREYAIDLETQIRFAGYRVIIEHIPQIVLFGYGVGSIGNLYSIKYNYSLFYELGIVKWGMNDWESTFAKSMMQVGVTGTILWYKTLIVYLYKVAKSIGKYKELTLLLLTIYILDTLINKAYNIPYIIILAVFISYQINIDNSKQGMK